MLAAQMWERHFAQSPLNREAGSLLHKEMLAFGAARDKQQMLLAIAGPLDPLSYTRSLSP